MFEDRRIIISFVLLAVLVISSVACRIAIACDIVTTNISSFAVDSTGKLYIQHEDDRANILVYENGVHIYTIDLRKSLSEATDKVGLRGAFFTIQKDTILVDTSVHICTLDLQGNLIDCSRDRTIIQGGLNREKRFLASNGDIYQKKYILGRTAIIKNDVDIVYQISILSMFVKWIHIISAPVLVFIVITAIRYYWKEYFLI